MRRGPEWAFFSFLNLGDSGFQPRKIGKFSSLSPPTASPFLPVSPIGLARFPSPLPTRKPAATSHNAKANPFFKALLEAAAIKRLSLPSLLWHCPSSRPADPGRHELEAFLPRNKSSSGTALFPTYPGDSCFTTLATLSAPRGPVLASATSCVGPLPCSAGRHSINP